MKACVLYIESNYKKNIISKIFHMKETLIPLTLNKIPLTLTTSAYFYNRISDNCHHWFNIGFLTSVYPYLLLNKHVQEGLNVTTLKSKNIFSSL